MFYKGVRNMYISEDELIDLQSVQGIHQDDVAMFIDNSETLEELVSELKEYFKLDKEYYTEREEYRNIVNNA